MMEAPPKRWPLKPWRQSKEETKEFYRYPEDDERPTPVEGREPAVMFTPDQLDWANMLMGHAVNVLGVLSDPVYEEKIEMGDFDDWFVRNGKAIEAIVFAFGEDDDEWGKAMQAANAHSKGPDTFLDKMKHSLRLLGPKRMDILLKRRDTFMPRELTEAEVIKALELEEVDEDVGAD